MKQIAEALNKLQSELTAVAKDRLNPHFKVKYADLAAVWETIREPLTRNGLSIVQLPCKASEGHVGLRTIILHTSGEFLEDSMEMPLKDPTNPQAAGSAITYARRYSLMAAVGIAPDDDDDGNAANAGSGKGAEKVIEEAKKAFFNTEDVETWKGIYKALKENKAVPPSAKTEVLKVMAESIKKVSANG